MTIMIHFVFARIERMNMRPNTPSSRFPTGLDAIGGRPVDRPENKREKLPGSPTAGNLQGIPRTV
jgi:hypothetical protein